VDTLNIFFQERPAMELRKKIEIFATILFIY